MCHLLDGPLHVPFRLQSCVCVCVCVCVCGPFSPEIDASLPLRRASLGDAVGIRVALPSSSMLPGSTSQLSKGTAFLLCA
ncbi:cDNA sequence BC017612, isoform CRA_a [Mus musculus]|nr:cDNA sequence BC017612, isoform CRA_a [Mus musculus]EDL25031.1 cDNA sequence BC017612, isoform CRA_a [Mus musculus]EDL25032.1 cDNA sequence BC017612, isoform CRA_a [Mus musculus]